MFADSLLTVRGERSLFFGADARPRQRTGDEYGGGSGFMDLNNEESDFFFKGYLDIGQLRAGYAAGPREPRDLLEGFVEGYNRYLKDAGGKLPAACADAKWVRPMTLDDMVLVVAEKALHASGQAFARDFVAAGRVPGASVSLAKRAPRKIDVSSLVAQLDQLNKQGFGSNALAVGKDLSANGRGLLLGNPHYPWTTTDRFYQAHLTVPGRYDAMGVIIGGIPAVVIGFNRDVAWSHTVTFAYHFTTFRLALDPADASGTTYVYDGERRRMTSKTVHVDALLPDGLIGRRSKTFYFSHQGAVISRPAAHGGNGNQEGTYGSLTMRSGLTAQGYVGAHWGQSYIQTVAFDEQGPVAQAMLTYGQSTDPRSPWYAEQTMVYSRKEWPSLPFMPEKIRADPHYTTVTLRE